jgi:hypothetical protein
MFGNNGNRMNAPVNVGTACHEILSTDRVATVGESAWHDLGLTIPKDQRPATFVDLWKKLWGNFWSVEQCPLQAIRETAAGVFRLQVDRSVANVRSDNAEVLGVVGKGFKPWQPLQQCEFSDNSATDDVIHDHVHIGGGHDLAKVNVKAVGKQQHVARL